MSTASDNFDQITQKCKDIVKTTTPQDYENLESLEGSVEEFMNSSSDMSQDFSLHLWEKLKVEIHVIAWFLHTIGIKSGVDNKAPPLDDAVRRQVISLLKWVIHVVEICESINSPSLFSPKPAVKDVEAVLERVRFDAYLKLRSTRGNSEYYAFFQINGHPVKVETFLIDQLMSKYPNYVINIFALNGVFLNYPQESQNPDHLLALFGLERFTPAVPKQYRPFFIEESLKRLEDLEKGKIKRNGQPDGYAPPPDRYGAPVGYVVEPPAAYAQPARYGTQAAYVHPAAYGPPSYHYDPPSYDYEYGPRPGPSKARRPENSVAWKQDKVQRKKKQYGPKRNPKYRYGQDGYAEPNERIERDQDGQELDKPKASRKQYKKVRSVDTASMFGFRR